MKIVKKTLRLYTVPSVLIPDDALVTPGTASLPSGLLPCLPCRSDANCYEKLQTLWKWYQDNLNVVDGYLPASAALPALSLNDELWGDALFLLKKAMSGYERVEGPVFVRQCGGRTALFAVADLYQRLLYGSTTIPVVTFRVLKTEGDDTL